MCVTSGLKLNYKYNTFFMPAQIKLDSKKFQGHFKKMSSRMARYMEHDLPRIIGTEAVNHFKKSFDDEGFTGSSLDKWKPAKRTKPSSQWYGFQYKARTRLPNNHPRRRKAKGPYKPRKPNPITNYSPAATKRRTLTGQTGDLKESIDYRRQGDKIVIYSDQPYADVHNRGGQIKVFGKKTVSLPQRQFIGDSPKLNAKITREIQRDLNRIFKK